MKRIVYIVTVFIICLMLLCPMAAYAEEAAIETELTDTNVEVLPTPEGQFPAPPTEEETSAEEKEESPNLFTRLYEAFMGSKTDIFTLLGSGVLLVLSLILKKDMGASSKEIIKSVSNVLSKTDISAERQEAIVGGLNEMIDGYEEIKKQSDYVKNKISEYGDLVTRIEESNAESSKKLEALLNVVITLIDKEILQNEEVMEVLSTVYVNNNALPQGVKDYVVLKRAENAKLVKEATEISNTVTVEGGEEI